MQQGCFLLSEATEGDFSEYCTARHCCAGEDVGF